MHQRRLDPTGLRAGLEDPLKDGTWTAQTLIQEAHRKHWNRMLNPFVSVEWIVEWQEHESDNMICPLNHLYSQEKRVRTISNGLAFMLKTNHQNRRHDSKGYCDERQSFMLGRAKQPGGMPGI